MVAQVSIRHPDLLSHPHLLFDHFPDPTVVAKSLVRLDSLVVVAKFDHDVSLCLEQAVKDQFVVEEGVPVVSELSHEVLEHFLDRLHHLVNNDTFDPFQFLMDIVDVLNGVFSLFFVAVQLHRVVNIVRHELFLVEVVRLQDKVHHAFVLVLNRIDHAVQLLLRLVDGRRYTLNPIYGPPDDALVLIRLVVANQLCHLVEIFLPVLFDQFRDPSENGFPELTYFLLESELFL